MGVLLYGSEEKKNRKPRKKRGCDIRNRLYHKPFFSALTNVKIFLEKRKKNQTPTLPFVVLLAGENSLDS